MESQTSVRPANVHDIPQLVNVDRNSYGEYGADGDYFSSRLASPDAKVLVVEVGGTITGFAVLEMVAGGRAPDEYANLDPNTPPQNKWIQIGSFTTRSNYLDAAEDKKLVDAIEDFGKTNGCNSFGTCLSIDHPYPAAFGFWEKNGYEKTGTIQWVGSPKEPIDCYFYLKRTT